MVELTWEAEQDGDGVLLKLSGIITESAEFSPLLESVTGRVRLDLSGIRRINSSGVREWIRFIEALSDGREVLLERCAVPIVQQLNMISNMAGRGHVVSVMLPYYCGECDEEITVLCELGDKVPDLAESLPCARCGGSMEFDEIPENYLSFAAGRK